MKNSTFIKFYNPLITNEGKSYLNEVIESGNMAGPNIFTTYCENFLKKFLIDVFKSFHFFKTFNELNIHASNQYSMFHYLRA